MIINNTKSYKKFIMIMKKLEKHEQECPLSKVGFTLLRLKYKIEWKKKKTHTHRKKKKNYWKLRHNSKF